MIQRTHVLSQIRRALSRSRVVSLIGPRQCGKTTLARQIVPSDSLNYFDLEDPASLARLAEPITALADLRGVVVIDEVQRRPDLFPVLRVLADRRPLPARFLILGSASPVLLRQSSESLAGRLETVPLSSFSLAEVGVNAQTRHWQRGGFPRSYLARSHADSLAWRRQFIQTFLERDLPQLGVTIPAPALWRCWTMLAHYHGHRWHANLKKRQVKAPKVYLRDSGLLHQLLGIRTERDLLAHPKCGASWEGYAIEETLKAVQPDEAYFWATHTGAELDLLLFKNRRRLGVEVKRADAPTLTPSMRIALHDLQLDHLTVLYPGTRWYALAERVDVVPLAALATGDMDALFPHRGKSIKERVTTTRLT